jgi:hypothetical protein
MTKVKGAKGWDEGYGSDFTKMFGPMKATAHRKWPVGSSAPVSYEAFLTDACGRAEFGTVEVTIAEVGVEWFDEAFDTRLCKMLDKRIKALIRSWTR